MRARHLLVVALVLVSTQLFGFSCFPPTIIVSSPAGTVTTFSFTIDFELVGSFTGTPEVFLNFEPQTVTGGPTNYSVSVDPGDPLQAENYLLIKAAQTSGPVLKKGKYFSYDPVGKASVAKIGDLADCPVSGPLAHVRVGDYCLQNADVRFVVQDVTKPVVATDPTPRDLYSVGQFGGNIIDAVLVSNPTTDNFLEFQTGVNLETVLNAQDITIVNTGDDGTAAILEACGPDDLLDFANPSSQLVDAGINPPGCVPLTQNCTDDNDQDVWVCTTYTLEPGEDYARVDSKVTNNSAVLLRPYVGDWMNAAGEVDGFFKPNVGVGEAVFQLSKGGLDWFAEPSIEGSDRFEYAYAPLTTNGVGSYVQVSGVTVILHDINAVLALLGSASNFFVPAGGNNTFTRFFGVGSGDGNLGVEIADIELGRSTGTVSGCVTIDGVAAPSAKVTIGTLDAGLAIDQLLGHFVTDGTGCYSGQIEVPLAAGTNYGAAAAKKGVLFVGGGATPPVTQFELFPAGDVEVLNFDLPATGTLHVDVTDENSSDLPARVTVVGFDPSPEPTKAGNSIPGFGGATLGLFEDVGDGLQYGVVAFDYTGSDGASEFLLEPGTYHVYVTRGSEYSAWSTQLPPTSGPITITGNNTTTLTAQIARVVETPGFISADFHVHGIASADSQVADATRANEFAGEGIENLVATDHHVHTDYKPAMAAAGLSSWVTSTVGEEITTFDYGHFNGYPFTIDATLPSGGSTDWAVAEPPGEDFPSLGAYNLSPAGVDALAKSQPQSTASTTMQINHIDSHFAPLKIDTSIDPPTDSMSAADRATRRLDPASPPLGQLYHQFDALELWNGYTRGHQLGEFLGQRIGIWFNLLDQNRPITAIADTDTHSFRNLRSAGARSWTAAPAGSDTPATYDEDDMAASVQAGRVVGGQGIFVTARLLADDGSGLSADLTFTGSNTVLSAGGDVTFEVSIQAPKWAQFDSVEIYTNAGGSGTSSAVVDALNPYLYSGVPNTTLSEGDCNPATTGDGDFDITVNDVYPLIDDAERWEATVSQSFTGLSADTWFVAVVKGTDGVCRPMYPVFPASLTAAGNTTLSDLVDGNLGEGGVMALGYTNALNYQN